MYIFGLLLAAAAAKRSRRRRPRLQLRRPKPLHRRTPPRRQTITEAEAIAFATRLIEAPETIVDDTEIFDLSRILEVVLEGVNPQFSQSLKRGVASGFKQGAIIRRLQADLAGGTGRLLQVRGCERVMAKSCVLLTRRWSIATPWAIMRAPLLRCVSLTSEQKETP